MKAKFMKKLLAGFAAFTMLAGTMFGSIPAQATDLAPEESVVAPQPKNAGRLTINKKDGQTGAGLDGVKFTIVRIMDLTPGAAAGEFAEYSFNSDFAEALKGAEPDELGNYNAQQLDALIDELLVQYEALSMSGVDDASRNIWTRATAGGGKAVFDKLPLGYYLVVESKVLNGYTQIKPFLVAIPSPDNYQDPTAPAEEWLYDVEVEAKNVTTDIDKTVENKDGDFVDEDTVTVGDVKTFHVDVTVPTWNGYDSGNAAHQLIYKIADKMSRGLKLDETSMVIEKFNKSTNVWESVLGGSKGAGTGQWDYTVSQELGDGSKVYSLNEHGFQLQFFEEFLANNMGAKLRLTYEAEITEEAVIGTADGVNSNNVTAGYNHDPSEEDATDFIDDSVKLYTFAVQVDKFALATTSKKMVYLADATFGLYTDAEGTTPALADTPKITTEEDGIALFARLAEGTYWLVEEKSPEGYKLLTNPIKVEIKADRDAYTGRLTGGFTFFVNGEEVKTTEGEFVTKVDYDGGTGYVAVENKKGFTLPETGGMGIAIFLIIGIVGILALSVAMMRKKKA